MLPKVPKGKRVLIIAEKPDEGTRIAATIGGVMIDGLELTGVRLNQEAFAEKVKKHRKKGYLEGRDKFGTPYVMTWGYGHLYRMYQAKDYNPNLKWNLTDFPFFPDVYRFKPDPNKIAQIKRINAWLNDPRTAYVIAATDPDREGEGIFALIYEGSKSKKKVYRLWIDDLTEAGISQAMGHLRDYHEPYLVGLRNSQAARMIVDWAIGANFTVLCTRKFGPRGEDGRQQMLSIGRVQTATLAMVVQREKEIQNFVPTITYAVEAKFRAQNGDYKGVLKRGKEEVRFQTEAEARAFIDSLKKDTAKIEKVHYTVKKEVPPLLFDITSIQTEASKRFKYSVQLVLDTVQELYEKQFVSYPRTDSRFLTPQVGAELPEILQSLPPEYSRLASSRIQAAMRPGKRLISHEPMAHYALIPTKTAPDLSKLTEPQRKIYDLIVRSLLAALSESAEWGHTEMITSVSGEPFVTKGKMLIKAGWRDVYGVPTTKEDLPTVTVGEVVVVRELQTAKKETQPPKRYTDGTLVKAMENAGNLLEEDDEAKEMLKIVGGIGTPATRTGIITRLLSVGYLVQDKKTSILTPTNKAFQVIDRVPVDAVKSPKYTAEIESYLEEIVEGKRSKEEVVRMVENFVKKVSNEIKAVSSIVPPAGGKSILTPKSSGSKRGRAVTDIPCPQCGHSIVERDKFYGCSNYKAGCHLLISKEVGGHSLTKTEVKALLTKGKTSKKVKFKSKAGKEYEDYLVLSNGRAIQAFRVS